MNHILKLTVIFMVVSFSAFAQKECVLFNDVQQAKITGVHFENVKLKEANRNETVLRNFLNPNEVFFFDLATTDLFNSKTRAINLVLPFNNKNKILELVEVSESFYDYVVTTSCGQSFPASRDIKHYRGVVQGEENSLVAITFFENKVTGLIATNDGNFNLLSDKQSDRHIFYNTENLKERKFYTCTTEDVFDIEDSDFLFEQDKNFGKQKLHDEFQNSNRAVKFYFETEYGIFQTRGSIASVEVYVTTLFNQVATIYQNENIPTEVSDIHIRNLSGIYNASTPKTLLTQFQNNRTSINGDLGILLTFRPIGGGEAAGVRNALCTTSTSARLAVAEVHNATFFDPVYDWSVMVVAHEFGHLFGIPHTNSCYWRGINGQPIDRCGGTQPDPFGNPNSICPAGPLPANGGGTIMSLCHLVSNVGIRFANGFGHHPGNLLRDNYSNSTCLQICTFINLQGTQPPSPQTHRRVECRVIEVENVTVPSGTTLELDAEQRVSIGNGFKVNSGGTFIIR